MNAVTIIGNIGTTPELREFSNGGGVVGFSFCHSWNKKNAQGEWESIPGWYAVKIFLTDKQLEFSKRNNTIAQLFKGAKVMVLGEIIQEKYTSSSGEEVTKPTIQVRGFENVGISMFSKRGPEEEKEIREKEVKSKKYVEEDIDEVFEEEDLSLPF